MPSRTEQPDNDDSSAAGAASAAPPDSIPGALALVADAIRYHADSQRDAQSHLVAEMLKQRPEEDAK